MRWAALASFYLAASSTAHAYVPLFGTKQTVPLTTRGDRTRISVGGVGWDNDNFLDALSGGDDALNQEKEKYEALSRFRPGAEPPKDDDELPQAGVEPTADAALTDEMKERMKASHTDDPGGKLFKQLMERAQAGSSVPRPMPQAVVPPPPAATPPQQPPPNMEGLSVEEQAALFRQMMAQQQQQPQVAPPLSGYAPLPPMPAPQMRGGLAPDGRKIGRNRDADAIVNTADVYFAQLKIDSQTRNMARYSGDEEKANQVFVDPRIKEIKMATNPFLEEAREKEKQLIETAVDEMITPEMFMPKEEKPATYSGVSYKEKLKQKQMGGAAKAATPPPPTTASQASMAPPTTESAPPTAAGESPVAPPQPIAPPEPVSAAAVPSATIEPELVPAADVPPAAAPSTPVSVEDNFRKEIRTLMGMLLKHRGGPGFGAGRLQGAEVEKFDELAKSVMHQLRQEASQNPGVFTEAAEILSSPRENDASVQSASLSNGSSSQRVTSMIACIEGAILMYRNSPEELKEGVLITLRAALLSAINSLNEVVTGPVAPTQSAAGTGTNSQQVDTVISLLEGAIQMYKNSPPELQEGILVTLRGALLSGIGVLNRIIATNEAINLQTYQASAGTLQPPSPQAPAPEVPGPAVSQAAPVVPSQPTDENSKFFEQVYNRLESIHGEGKMGLRGDVSSDEAAALAADLSDMRMMLVDELETGIPSSSASSDSTTFSSTQSKYQEMLAKAKAEKEG